MTKQPTIFEIKRGRATALSLLGLQAGCSLKQLKRTYRKKAMLTHPDKGGDEKAFILVNEANQFLLKWGTGKKNEKHEPDPFSQVGLGGFRVVEHGAWSVSTSTSFSIHFHTA